MVKVFGSDVYNPVNMLILELSKMFLKFIWKQVESQCSLVIKNMD